MESVDVVVVGAGVVGLAVARRLALDGLEVMVLEAEDAVGTQTSSRNSEVIHAGIYYPTGSRKASACVAGREMLYRYCTEAGIPHRRIGKLIVATDEDQLPALDQIVEQARANGVVDLRPVSRTELRKLEPELTGIAAVLSPSTGIVDGHALMEALRRDAEAAGAGIALRSRVVGGSVMPGPLITLEVDGAGVIGCRGLVSCAGLGAWDLVAHLRGYPVERIPPRRVAKGNYFTPASGVSPFGRLIYPLPVDGGLGIHLTLDMGGAARFGPDVEWTDGGDLSVDPHRAELFAREIRHYWPAVDDHELAPAYAGLRPKLSGPGEPPADFLLQGPAGHGIPGLVALFGIESPGLTSCLALARDVATMLGSDALR
ncbi:NAD(P)/FAD-dependent oxidoreductase [Gordonia sp. OPL2]|uniref:NAD(P)/FAD-dependent oxidoreductase n=1 Tax=Gordonia sp. OPL2 TaxID=2486274 RepID=UPI0016551850|nr:NAD(P)/FAD-dependent oxidoreductase [Gordonia sp. OPL2]